MVAMILFGWRVMDCACKHALNWSALDLDCPSSSRPASRGWKGCALRDGASRAGRFRSRIKKFWFLRSNSNTIMKAQCTSTVLLAALILLLSSLSSVLAFTPHHTISGSIRYHQQKLISMNSSSNDDTPASHPRTVDHHPFCDLPGDP